MSALPEPRWITIDGPTPEHVLTYSTAKILIQNSPKHAWLHKKRVEIEEHDDASRDAMARGHILEAMVFGGGRKIAVLPFDDFRTKEAREARDAAEADGALVVKQSKAAHLQKTADRIKADIKAHGYTLDGERQAGVQWWEQADDGTPVECRGALDLWQYQTGTIFDLKIVRSGHPRSCDRQIYKFGYQLQATAYTKAIEALYPKAAGRVKVVFLFAEAATGIVTPRSLDGEFARLGDMQWRRAINTWARCLKSGEWPAYVRGLSYASPPPYAIEDEITASAPTLDGLWPQQPAGDDAGEEPSYDNIDNVF